MFTEKKNSLVPLTPKKKKSTVWEEVESKDYYYYIPKQTQNSKSLSKANLNTIRPQNFQPYPFLDSSSPFSFLRNFSSSNMTMKFSEKTVMDYRVKLQLK